MNIFINYDKVVFIVIKNKLLMLRQRATVDTRYFSSNKDHGSLDLTKKTYKLKEIVKRILYVSLIIILTLTLSYIFQYDSSLWKIGSCCYPKDSYDEKSDKYCINDQNQFQCQLYLGRFDGVGSKCKQEYYLC